MLSRTSIGGLLLEDVVGWKFSVQNGVIVGQFREDPEILRIATLASNRMPHPVTHEACLSRAAGLAEVADPKPSDWVRSESVTGPYGSVNFDRGSDRVFVWYCCRAPGVILGIYSCSIDLSRTWASRALRIQCNAMITTAVFDRRVWGGNDDLTRWLVERLDADDVEDE